jgi:phosphohistidine phosphatase
MRLYFFRHAQAGERLEDEERDFHRKITAEGRRETRAAAKVLADLNLKVTHIYSSPLTRAEQTAGIVAQALDMPVEIREEVGPGFNIAAIEKIIADLPETDNVMFVGHDPDFSQVVSKLIGGGTVEVKKGGFARIDLTSRKPLRGTLIWLAAPRIFNRFE